MRAVIECPDPQYPVLDGVPLTGYVIKCSGGSAPTTSPVLSGLAELDWSDVSILIGALLLSATLATAFNILSKMFHRG